MLSRFYSFKLIIILALLWLTLLAFGLAYYSTQIFRNLAVENQLESLQTILAVKSQDIIEDLYDNQKRFAFKLQSEEPFVNALRDQNSEAMISWLGKSFRRYFVASGQFDLKSIIVRNQIGEIIAEVGDDYQRPYSGCPVVMGGIGESDLTNLKPRYALCSFEGDLYSEALVPIGTPDPKGYLHVIAYALEGLKMLEQDFEMPLRITASDGSELFRSGSWPESPRKNFLYPEYLLYGDDSFLGASITGAFDQQPFINRLDRTEYKFLALATFATLAGLALVVLLLYRAFVPMNKLRNSVGALLTGKYDAISEDKLPSELRDVVRAYNEMVEGLEIETISRRQTEEKLRSEKDFIATTLNSITNPVIVIDSKDKIKLVNPSGEKLFGEKERLLVNTSVHELLILYSNRQTTHIVNLSHLLRRKQTLDTLFFYDANREIVELEFSASPMIDMEAEDVGFVVILKDVSEYGQLRRKLTHEGSHDQLTGFLNRVAFEHKFDRLVAEDHGLIPQHVFAFLDIDQFKVVNETCGNPGGDLLLKQISTIIKSHVRKSDVLARLSGDEFGIIMPFFNMDRALQAIQKIIIDIQYSGFEWDEKEYDVTASVGMMPFGQEKDEYPTHYSKVATACFLAKSNGGNQYHYIDENDEKVTAQQESMDWVASIMKGFSEDRFCLYVQPIASLDSKDNDLNYEVLVRYQSPEGTIISPDKFLPSAERYNLIERIDCWVVTHLIEWLQVNQDKTGKTMFSINLSGRSMGSQTFHNFLQQSLEQTEVDKTTLCFEITETAVSGNVKESIEFINSIRRLGAKFSIDDFGTGLSSFSDLKQFPVEYLKIDGDIVREINEDDTNFVFLRSMTEVGHSLGMKVIAEQVESGDLIDKLREANIDFIQGHTIGLPVEIQSLVLK